MKYILTIIFSFFVVGCSYEDIKESIVPKEESSFANVEIQRQSLLKKDKSTTPFVS